MFIYLAFPILIVPSSLPAIKALFIEKEFPREEMSVPAPSGLTADAQIYELNIPQVPTLQDKIRVLSDLHRQGMAKIFPTD